MISLHGGKRFVNSFKFLYFTVLPCYQPSIFTNPEWPAAELIALIGFNREGLTETIFISFLLWGGDYEFVTFDLLTKRKVGRIAWVVSTRRAL